LLPAGFTSLVARCQALRSQRVFLLVVLGLFGGSTLYAQSPSTQSTSARYGEALKLVRAGDFARGCEAAEELTQKLPSFYAAYNLLGLCATQSGDRQKAEAFFRRSLQLSPRFLEARINLAVNLAERGNTRDAVSEFNQVLNLDPKNVTSLYNLGRLELATGAADKAVMPLRRAHRIAPQDWTITVSLADALLATRQRVPALELLAPVVRNAQESEALIAAALVALRAKDEALGREAVGKALRLDTALKTRLLTLARVASVQGKDLSVRALLEVAEPPVKDSAEWNALYGYSLYKLGDPKGAMVYLRRALELSPDVEDYYLKMGEMLLHSNSGEAAVAFFQAGLERLPRSPLLHYGLAVSYWSYETDLRPARESIEKALRLEPDFQQALSLLCQLAYRQEDWTALGDAADRLMRTSPKLYEGPYYKGLAVAEGIHVPKPCAVFEQARHLFEQALRLDPGSAKVHLALGKLLLKHGQLSLAIPEFERAVRADPENPDAYYNLATAYRNVGQREKSTQAFSKFEQLNVKQPQGREVLFQVSR
jgi:tetratricopeptide (TPR) repeat protein